MTIAARVVEGRFDTYRVAGEPLSFPAGRSRIYEVEGRPELYYKELHEAYRGDGEVRRVEELVAVGTGLAAADRSSPSRERIAWPRDFCLADDAVVGVIIPFAGKAFYRETSGEMLMPRGLSYLRRADEGLAAEVRLQLMRQLAGVLALLEHADLVHGDISAQNVLWSHPPQASIMLIDCDGMHSASTEGSEATTDGWADPRKEDGEIATHDMRSDWFALALAIWRVTTLSKGAPLHENGRLVLPSRLPSALAELMKRTFDDVMDPDPRPSPGEWIDGLDSVLGSSRARRGIDRIEPAPVVDPAVLFEYQADTSLPPAGSWPWESELRSPLPRTSSRNPSARKPKQKRRLRRGWIVFFAVVLALAGLLIRGCADGGPRGPEARAEAAVAHWVKSRLRTGEVSARCPGSSSLHAGARYACGVETGSGALARVQVAIGDHGGISRRVHVIAYRSRAVAADIRARYQRIHRQGGYGLARIACPDKFSARPGTAFRCRARFTDGVTGKIAIYLYNRHGFYGWHEVGANVRGLASGLR